MTGNVAQVEGKPFVHVHAVLTGIKEGSENQPIGGHVFEAKVAVTLEVELVAYNENIARALDNSIGLKLLDI
jgi:predicted DNA-binding protein with PD1-like motif